MSVTYVSAARPKSGARGGRARRSATSWRGLLGLTLSALGAAWAISSEEGAGVAASTVEAAGAPTAARALAGHPTRITDGDTFRLGEVRIRLHGVNAPEMRTPDGRPARLHLEALIGPGPVECQDTGGRSYQRVVAICRSASGRELGRAMVEDGWALDAPRFSRGHYARYEQAARRDLRGMHAG